MRIADCELQIANADCLNRFKYVAGSDTVCCSSGSETNWQSAVANRQSPLAVFSSFSQIVVDHSPPILLRFGNRRVATFFVAADFVFGIETFQH